MKPDKATAKILSETEELDLMVRGTGWSIARRRLILGASDLLNISFIKTEDPIALSAEIKARKMAADYLLAFINDIEGEAKRNRGLQELFKEETDGLIFKLAE